MTTAMAADFIIPWNHYQIVSTLTREMFAKSFVIFLILPFLAAEKSVHRIRPTARP
jgi:hypothetical protein